MKIGSIGYNYVHDMKYENFVMDRPKGPGAVLLLFIKTPAVFKVGEVQYQVKENSCNQQSSSKNVIIIFTLNYI